MKKKVFILISLLLATFISVVIPSQANAGDCGPENPCGTWAVVDNSGTVTNIIVCQASVCGGGEFAGQKVVLQVTPDPQSGQARGGFFGGNENQSGIVKFEENKNIFTVFDVNGNNHTSFSAPELESDGSYTSTSSSSCNKTTPIGGSECVEVNSTNESKNNIITESNIFTEKKTEEQIKDEFSEKGLNLLLFKINTILKLLDGWLIK
jgi:hypothetical protein